MEFQLLYDNVCTAAPSKENNRENCVDENPNEGMKYEDEDDEKCVFKCYCTMCFSFQAAVVVEMGWILSLSFSSTWYTLPKSENEPELLM